MVWGGGHHTCTISRCPVNTNTSHFDTCRYVYLQVSFAESTMDVGQVAFVSHDGERVQDHPLLTGDKLKRNTVYSVLNSDAKYCYGCWCLVPSGRSSIALLSCSLGQLGVGLLVVLLSTHMIQHALHCMRFIDVLKPIFCWRPINGTL